MNKDIKALNVDFLLSMAHSPIKNYGIPGLTSWLIGNPSERGCVRLFECFRNHQENITPHSHRFDLHCVVLSGDVTNRLWYKSLHGDEFNCSKLKYFGEIGDYEKTSIGVRRYSSADYKYCGGECYSMTSDEIHSIYFTRGTRVLFFEGPKKSDDSIIIEPFFDNEIIKTFEFKPWMFKR